MVEAFAAEELNGVGRHDARGDHVGAAVGVDDDIVEGDGSVEEVVGDADGFVVDTRAAGEGTLADVEVDECDALAGGDEGVGEVDDGECLAGTFAEGGGHDDAGVKAVGFHHHTHIGDDHAESVVGDGFHHGAAVLVGFVGAEEGAASVEGAIEGHFAEEWDGDGILDVASATHARVHKCREEYDDSGEEESGEAAEHEDAVAVGGDASDVAVGAFDDAGVVVGHCLCEGVFFAAVEEEEVERLLNLLLTLDREDFALLARD